MTSSILLLCIFVLISAYELLVVHVHSIMF